jgi:hypothetical protein
MKLIIWGFIALAGILLTVAACNPCREEVGANQPSPGGKWIATTVLRDCGATGPEVLSVNIHANNEQSLKESNNVLEVKHDHKIDLRWLAPSLLEVDCKDCDPSEILGKRDELVGVKIRYRDK